MDDRRVAENVNERAGPERNRTARLAPRSRPANSADISSPYSFRNEPDTKGEGSGIRASLTPFRRKTASARQLDEVGEPRRFRSRHRGAERGDAVVATPLVVFFGGGPFAGFDDEALLEQTLNRSIQCPGAEFQLAAGARGHVLDDRVAVAVVVGKRHQNVEGRGRQWEQ